jgi:hypothetical protein
LDNRSEGESDDFGLLVSHPIKPVDGCDVTLLCAVASIISPLQSKIAGSNEMSSFFIITFLSFESPFGAKSKILETQCLHGSTPAGRAVVGPQGDLRKPVLRIGN